MRIQFTALAVLLLASGSTTIASSDLCPFLKGYEDNKVERRLQDKILVGNEGDGGVIPPGGFEAVKEDIRQVLVTSEDFWPADFGNYGPFMVRLAWHCTGSYRRSDGRGGCDGGRIRFDPEANWPDNANLDQALTLIEPIKIKYGADLSWGDLIVLTGTTAIEFMGFPSLGFCGGRIDAGNGTASVPLGPTDLQRVIAPCEVNGECAFPLGPTTVGLIYINPAGPLGVPDTAGSVDDIRNSFGNMGFNDSESVSLIGGGHAFGKCHGACPSSEVVGGVCGEGVGADGNQLTFTSGFELQWTTIPTTWSNQYFNNLLNFDYNLTTGPSGNPQWTPTNRDGTPGPPQVAMLTSDLAFLVDPIYAELVNLYASDIAALERDFAASWYRLVSQDMGPESRCIGEFVLPPQPFQQPLPAAPAVKPDFIPVRASIQAMIDDGSIAAGDLTRLAFQCASTYRATDFSGGCNGARIRFPPESEWPINAGLDAVLTSLAAIDRGAVSMADLIVLAGNTALESVGGDSMSFCGGRVDTDNAAFSENLAPRDFVFPARAAVRDDFDVMGLTAMQGVALFGRPSERYPVIGSLFTALTTDTFVETNGMFVSDNGGPPVTPDEFALVEDAEYRAIIEGFVADMASFRVQLNSGWTYLMTADRFSGPRDNVCTGVNDPTLAAAPVIPGTPGGQDPPGRVNDPDFRFVLPVWFNDVEANFDGEELRRCFRRQFAPAQGQRCATIPKTCFFGDQVCPGNRPWPVTRCDCNGSQDTPGAWSCAPAACPPLS